MSDVPKRPPRTSRARSCVDVDKEASEKNLQVTAKDTRSLVVNLSQTDTEQNPCGSLLSEISSDIETNATIEERCCEQYCSSNLKADLNQIDKVHTSMQLASTNACNAEVRRRSPKTRRAPPAPFIASAKVEVEVLDCSDGINCKLEADNSAEKPPVLSQDSAIENRSSSDSSQVRVDAASGSCVMNEPGVPSSPSVTACKPALKPKPSARLLRDTGSKNELPDSQLLAVDSKTHGDNQTFIPAEGNNKLLENQTANQNVPIYAAVDKSRKRTVCAELLEGGVTASQAVESSCQMASAAVTEPIDQLASNTPPKKPPRTFAHSEYMKIKSASLPPSASHNIHINCDYEEIDAVRQQSALLDSSGVIEASKDTSDYASSGTEVPAVGCIVRRRQINDKLPAPPRPPPPAVSDSKRSSLPVGQIPPEDDSEIGCFTRHSMLLRSSERAVKSDRRKPERSVSMLESRQTDRRRAERKGQIVKTAEGDGIYAVPGEILASDSEAPKEDVHCHGNSDNSPHERSGRHADSPNQRTRVRIRNAYSILRLNVSTTDEMETFNEASEVSESITDPVVLEGHQRRVQHVSTVRERTQSRVMKNLMARTQQFTHLFEFAVIVSLKRDVDSNLYNPTAVFLCPEQGHKMAESVAQFCFPDSAAWRPVSVYKGERFTFVLTDSDGTRRFGYCRRYLPPGTGNRLPESVCIVSPLCEINLYTQLLTAVEEKLRFLGGVPKTAHDILCAAYEQPCPMPNCEVQIPVGAADQLKFLILRRAGENLPENVSFEALLSLISEDTFVLIFASLLLERRIVFCAQNLSTLTTCIFSLLAVLYPFEWQHPFVPVLPSSMIGVLETTVPFVFGILSSAYAELIRSCFDFSEMLVIDLDGGKVLKSYGDEEQIIPQKLQKALTLSLKDETDSIGVREITVTETFLRFFIETCGHYTEYICTQQDGLGVFERDLFIKAVSSRSIQMFLEWFTVTQMFEVFMTEELQGRKHADFEARILEYREEMAAERLTSLRYNVKLVGKKIKDFFVESGGKLKKRLQHRNVFV